MITVGIDIGTSYSSICILGKNGEAMPVRVDTGVCVFGDYYSLPSAVFAEDTGELIIGQAAVAAKMRKPENFKSEFKRDLGQVVPYHLGNLQLRPEELYKEIFIHFINCAEASSGEKIEKAYITYPADYSTRKKELIRLAAQKAGMMNVEMLDEPTAAAYCYFLNGHIKENERLLVYDLGGGTFDISLIEYTQNVFKPITPPLGIDTCGGIDIDRILYDDMMSTVGEESLQILKVNETAFKRFNLQIMEMSVKAKHHLSSTEIFKDIIQVGFDYIEYEITRKRFNQMIEHIVDETIREVQNIIRNAKLKMEDIDSVLLVGGTTRIPLIGEKLEKLTGKKPFKNASQELVVCMGAALWNRQKRGDNKDRLVEENIKIDSTPESRQLNDSDDIRKNAEQRLVDVLAKIMKSKHEMITKQGNATFNNVNNELGTRQGEWIYYVNINGNRHIYKMKIDGSKKQELNQDISEHINVTDEWIYYKNRTDCDAIYKLSLDGKQHIKIIDDFCEALVVDKEDIYYINRGYAGSAWEIYKIKTDGTDKRCIMRATKGYRINCISLAKDWLYYSEYIERYKSIWSFQKNISSYIYKVRTNGTGLTKIGEIGAKIININRVDNWIYYISEKDQRLYKLRTDGTEIQSDE